MDRSFSSSRIGFAQQSGSSSGFRQIPRSPFVSTGQQLIQASQTTSSLSKSASSPLLAKAGFDIPYSVAHSRSKLQFQNALETQDKIARLRRLEQVQTEHKFRTSLRQQMDGARKEAASCVKLIAYEQGEEPEIPITTRSRTAAMPEVEQEAADMSEVPGLGPEDYPGFPTDVCPDELPDLSKSFSVTAKVLKQNPALYSDLRQTTTKRGISLARCIKPCIDIPGHPMVKSVGLVAGDAECYDLFRPLFDPVLQIVHPGWEVGSEHPRKDMNFDQLNGASLDPSGTYTKKVWIELRRNISTFPMPTAASRVQRRVLEQMLTSTLQDAIGGTYWPMPGSRSFTGRRGGTKAADMDALAEEDVTFDVPESALERSCGLGRDWPDARGVWVSEERDIFVWINDADHLRVRAVGYHTTDLKGAMRRLSKSESAIAARLPNSLEFAHSDRLGFLAPQPENVGTGLCAVVSVHLPRLGVAPGFGALCRKMKLRALREAEGDGWTVSNAERLGSTELQQVSAVGEGVRQLIVLEGRLENGEEIDLKTFVPGA